MLSVLYYILVVSLCAYFTEYASLILIIHIFINNYSISGVISHSVKMTYNDLGELIKKSEAIHGKMCNDIAELNKRITSLENKISEFEAEGLNQWQPTKIDG
jgi:hypothetical protein